MNPLITKIQESANGELRRQIFGLLDDRKGFSNWFDDIDEDLKQDIADGIDYIIKDFHRSSLISIFQANIERSENVRKKGNNGDGLPFENSPEIYGNARIEAYKNGFNQAIDKEITFMRETIKSLETWKQ
jgi:hypothetical protein